MTLEDALFRIGYPLAIAIVGFVTATYIFRTRTTLQIEHLAQALDEHKKDTSKEMGRRVRADVCEGNHKLLEEKFANLERLINMNRDTVLSQQSDVIQALRKIEQKVSNPRKRSGDG